ncbi:MAG: LLM class flavin-dependent oxidoreductase [Haloarculaceae archaeon]
MEFGLVLPSDRDREHDPVDCARTVVEQARLAEAAGIDSLWVGEHHVTERTYFDNFQVLTHLAGVTDDVGLGTSVCLASLHNPVELAERVANLDVLSEGRFTFGCGLGYRPKEFEVFGVDPARRVPRLRESVDLARRLWSEDDVTFEGQEFTFSDVSVNPKPVQDGGPDVWLGGGVESAVRRAAVHGDAWLPGPAAPWDELEALYGSYEDALDAEPAARPIWRDLFVADSAAAARERAKPAMVRKYETYASWGNQGSDAGLAERFDDYAEGRFLLGSPDDVIEEIQAYREAFGTDNFLFRTQWPGMDDEVAEASLERFCADVLPSF